MLPAACVACAARRRPGRVVTDVGKSYKPRPVLPALRDLFGTSLCFIDACRPVARVLLDSTCAQKKVSTSGSSVRHLTTDIEARRRTQEEQEPAEVEAAHAEQQQEKAPRRR
jgi:hypothetical protein